MDVFVKKRYIVCLFVSLFLLIPLTTVGAEALTDKATNMPVNKMWTIVFNYPVIESSITSDSIYVVNHRGKKQDVTIRTEGETVMVYAPEKGYEPGQTYTLHITSNVLGQVGKSTKSLSETIEKPFTIVDGYVVVNIGEDGKHSLVAAYATFAEANASLQENQGIRFRDQYVKIPSGLAATNPKAVTLVYVDSNLQKDYAGIAADTELVYVDATADYVKVNVAGQELYTKPGDITLIPYATAQKRSYYTTNDQGLWHHIYHHHSGISDAAYLVGEKPEFLANHVKYFSTDGINFVNENGEAVGESFAYFQYISPRVPTSYSAAELDQYIAQVLTEREKLSTKYANATTKSQLRELGETLKKVEKDHRINALLILSLAIHESDYGMSCHAQHYNNLFGLDVTDGNDQCSATVNTSANKYFSSVEKNITELINRLNMNYLNPLNMKDFRYNGLALGNKMIGMNVRYATDPYWGAKTAGHMYRIDSALGGKDYQEYEVGITTQPQVSVRKEPVVTTGANNNRAYQYKLDGSIKRFDKMPITISNTPSEKDDWYRVISELPTDGNDLYTVTDNVRIVDTH